MTKERYDACERIALNLVDWVCSQTNDSQEALLILGRSFALFAAQLKKPGVTSAAMQRSVIKALKAEMQQAADYIGNNKG